MANLPVLCMTCGLPLTRRLWQGVQGFESRPEGLRPQWEALGVRRACCKSVLLSSVDHSDEVLLYADYVTSQYVNRRVFAEGPRTCKTD